jgi:molybdate/tungstate transport system ATP-binding protein
MSAGASVEALALSLGAFRLKKLDFALSRGEILVILGPNGAGKSVTLELIAGFHRPESGRILVAGRDVTALPPEQRNVGFVVQNFGLFPHLSVAQNVAIARRRGRNVAASGTGLPALDDDAVLLEHFGVAHLAKRRPAELSPGEKQRVALARALAGAPDLFLFDEPFSALDAETHDQLRDELKTFLRALAIPAIFVSHDRGDAITLADKIVVLRDGAIVQSGPAEEALQRPANSFVARFIGIENVLSGRATETLNGLLTVAIGERTLRAASPAMAPRSDGSVFLSIRAEDVVIDPAHHAPPSNAGTNRLTGRIVELRRVGPLVSATIDCGLPLKAYLLRPRERNMDLERGSQVVAEVAPEAIHVMTD